MAGRYELEVTISSAKNLKNINWRHGPLKPYVVIWVDPKHKYSTHVDEEGDESPTWDAKLVIPLVESIENSTLYIDVLHANASEDVKPLIGSTKLKVKDIVDEAGIGEVFAESLKLKRPSGRPHGKLEVKVIIKESQYRAPDPYYAPPYGVPTGQAGFRDVPPPYCGTTNYPYAAPPSEYPYAAPYGAPPQYGQAYGAPPQYGQAYGAPAYGGRQSGNYGEYKEEKKSKYGMGTGIAVGAAAGLLGGLAIAEGVDYVEDKIADDAAEKVEEDLGYEDDDY